MPSYFSGLAVAGQTETSWLPRRWSANATVTLALYCHHLGGGYVLLTDKDETQKAWHLTKRFGHPVVGGAEDGAPGFNGAACGDDASIDNTLALVNYWRTALGAAAGPILAFGSSMGMMTACNLERRYPGTIKAMAFSVPAVDMVSIHNDISRADLTADLDAAAGGSANFLAYAAVHSPSNLAASLTMPKILWRAMDDPTVLPYTVKAFADASPNTTLIDVPTGGHSPVIAPPIDVAQWLAAHA